MVSYAVNFVIEVTLFLEGIATVSVDADRVAMYYKPVAPATRSIWESPLCSVAVLAEDPCLGRLVFVRGQQPDLLEAKMLPHLVA